ncbi:MAG: hypothetical protein GVY08_02135 [Bacteroidetes bacterium]|jgi:hypothetical protein|nr:hypothetical protein [Bacteroidota bacterium]
MKRIYSLILLFSFVLGILQPVMPMMEYVIAEGNLTELFHTSQEMACPLADIEMDTICQACDCCDRSEEKRESLLDTDFYPIPLQTVQFSGDNELTVLSEGHGLADEHILSHYYKTLVPPPRQV